VKRASRILGFAAARSVRIVCVTGVWLPALRHTTSSPRETILCAGERREAGRVGRCANDTAPRSLLAYAYTLVLVLMSAGIPVATVGVCFGIGWISYALTAEATPWGPPLRTLIAGHTVVAVALMMMATSPGLALLLTLWVITGFGGGTVFCIERLALAWGPGRVTSLETFENAGHVLGCSAALLVSLAGGGHSGAFILGACLL